MQELANVPADQFLTIVEERPLVLSCAIRQGDGAFVLSVTASPEQSVTIYGSEDLMNWTEVVQSTGGGEVLIVPPTTGVRFFKAQAEPWIGTSHNLGIVELLLCFPCRGATDPCWSAA